MSLLNYLEKEWKVYNFNPKYLSLIEQGLHTTFIKTKDQNKFMIILLATFITIMPNFLSNQISIPWQLLVCYSHCSLVPFPSHKNLRKKKSLDFNIPMRSGLAIKKTEVVFPVMGLIWHDLMIHSTKLTEHMTCARHWAILHFHPLISSEKIEISWAPVLQYIGVRGYV